ncbi:MAG: ATP-binding cassette domain-containing protein [Defluviitaleaceae bacterium]|nr:ATP-binding cassette domain-containing protein [Defluviitaleaceae bacterium]
MSVFVDIKKTFPDFSLDAKFESERETLALLGASGCGKSLILKCIAGIERPDSGRIIINGEVVYDGEKRINLPPQKRHVGFLFQNYALFPTKTVYDNIACVIKKPKAERGAIVADIIQKFQLENVQRLYPREISGGQQQRTALARILVSEPKIIMLDEPFSALDTQLKWSMEQEVSAVLRDFEGPSLLVSHDREEVYRMSDKIAVMDNGKVDSYGTKTDIFDTPRTLAAARMTGCKNISRAEKLGDYTVRALDWGITLTTAQPVPDSIKHVGVRASHITADSTKNRFPCHVHSVTDEPFDKIITVTFAEGGEKVQYVTSKSASEPDFLAIAPDKILLLE